MLKEKEECCASNESVKVLTVKNKMGIHARPAAMIVQLSSKYDQTVVQIQKGEEYANAKSIMGVMLLAAGQNARLTFKAKGKHAQELLEEMEALFERKFQES